MVACKCSDKDKLSIGDRSSGSSAKRAHSTPTFDKQSERVLAIQAVQQAVARPSSQSKQEQYQQQPRGRASTEHRSPLRTRWMRDRKRSPYIVDEHKDFKNCNECVCVGWVYRSEWVYVCIIYGNIYLL